MSQASPSTPSHTYLDHTEGQSGKDEKAFPNQPLSSSQSAHPRLELHPSRWSLDLPWPIHQPLQRHIIMTLQVLSTPSLWQDLEIHYMSAPGSCHVQRHWKPCKRCPTEWLMETVCSHPSTRNGCISHMSGSFFLQVSQHKWKLADALVHQRPKNKTTTWSQPNSNLIQKNKQRITQQTSNPQSENDAQGANCFMDHLPHLLPLATASRWK